VAGWTEGQKRAYRIADNRLSESSKWDDTLLGLELGDLSDAGFDLDLIGIGIEDLRRLGTAPGPGLPVHAIATGAVADEFRRRSALTSKIRRSRTSNWISCN
jgi:hypothetical protein